MKYYIYEIIGDKIGCTIDIKRRMRQQNFAQCIILEEHTDIYVASRREQELQKEKGYRVDTLPYWQAVENSNKIDRQAAGRAGNREGKALGGRKSKPNLTKEQLRKGMLIKRECIHCGKVSTPALIGRWHGDNCKLFAK